MPTAIDRLTLKMLAVIVGVIGLAALISATVLEIEGLDAGRAWDLAILIGGGLIGAFTVRHQPETPPDTTTVTATSTADTAPPAPISLPAGFFGAPAQGD